MIIVSQDKTMIFNFNNIETIGIGNPLENINGKFIILAETTSDNQYPIGEYKTEERAKEVLNEIILGTTIKQINGKQLTEGEFYMAMKCMEFNLYEIPEE